MANANGDTAMTMIRWSFPVGLALLLFFYLYGSGFGVPRGDLNVELTQTQLRRIEMFLDDFKLRNGFYPLHEGDARDGGGVILAALREDGDETTWEDLFKNHATFKSVAATDGGQTLIDAWGNPIHYRCHPPDIPMDKKTTLNPTFDLWSTGGDPGNTPEKWITNWGAGNSF